MINFTQLGGTHKGQGNFSDVVYNVLVSRCLSPHPRTGAPCIGYFFDFDHSRQGNKKGREASNTTKRLMPCREPGPVLALQRGSTGASHTSTTCWIGVRLKHAPTVTRSPTKLIIDARTHFSLGSLESVVSSLDPKNHEISLSKLPTPDAPATTPSPPQPCSPISTSVCVHSSANLECVQLLKLQAVVAPRGERARKSNRGRPCRERCAP